MPCQRITLTVHMYTEQHSLEEDAHRAILWLQRWSHFEGLHCSHLTGALVETAWQKCVYGGLFQSAVEPKSTKLSDAYYRKPNDFGVPKVKKHNCTCFLVALIILLVCSSWNLMIYPSYCPQIWWWNPHRALTKCVRGAKLFEFVPSGGVDYSM